MSRDLTLTVNIVPAGTTVLQSIAQKMVAGEWVHLDGATRTVGTTPNVVCTKPANIDYALSEYLDPTGQVFVWGSRARWNPVVKSIEFCGGRTHTYPRHYGRYTEEDHRFETWHLQTAAEGDVAPWRIGTHTFDRLTVNPYTGKVWLTDYKYPAPLSVFEFDSGPKSGQADYFVNNPKTTTTPHGGSLFAPTDWWSEPSSLTGAGAQGLLIVVMYGASGGVRFLGYNPLTNTWPLNVLAPNSTGHNYNMIGQYSKAKNCFVAGFSNNLPQDFYRLTADGVATRYTGTGVPPGGMQPLLGYAVWADDPVTGNYLVTYGTSPTDGQFWEFNPDGAGTWTRLPNLPVGMHWHLALTGDGGYDTALAAPLYGPEYNGVIAYLCSAQDYGRMWLYKHA